MNLRKKTNSPGKSNPNPIPTTLEEASQQSKPLNNQSVLSESPESTICVLIVLQ